MDKIIIIENIFTTDQRKKFLNDGSSYLVDWNEMKTNKGYYPGKQTSPNLHLNPKLKFYYDSIIKKVNEKTKLSLKITQAWINWTNGKKNDMIWHTHQCDIGCVYYMKTFTFFSNGTLFRDGFIKAPQNSLLIFPAHLEHTAPPSPLRFGRYTSGMDLILD